MTFIESNASELEDKIVNGEEAPPGEMTYMVSIKDESDRHTCGGFLISLIHVLTAAHCLIPYKEIRIPKYGGLYVKVGSHKLSEGGQRYNIKHLDYYKKYRWYNVFSGFGDIGLITV